MFFLYFIIACSPKKQSKPAVLEEKIQDIVIPVIDLEGFSGMLGAEAQSVNDGEAADFAIRGNIGGLNLTYNFQDQDLDNYEVPKNAVLEMHDDHDEEHKIGGIG